MIRKIPPEVNSEGKTPSDGRRTPSYALPPLLGRGMKPRPATRGKPRGIFAARQPESKFYGGRTLTFELGIDNFSPKKRRRKITAFRLSFDIRSGCNL